MEFPYNVATNVHKFNVQSFQWTLYQGNPSSLKSLAIGPEQIGAISENEHSESPLSILEIFWLLRNEEYLVFYDTKDSVLWVFDTLVSGSGTIFHEATHVSQVAKDYELQAVASGTFTSQQLRRTFDVSPNIAYHSNDDVRHSDASSSFTKLSSLDPDGRAITVYHAFLSALKLFFMKVLIKEGEWLELGIDSCIRFPEGIRLPSTDYGSPLEDFGYGAQHLCFDIRWSLSGAVTVSGELRSHAGFAKLSDVLKDQSTSGASIVDVGHPVAILPFGSRYEFAGFQKDDPNLTMINEPARRSTQGLLNRLGIHITSATTWARLRGPSGSEMQNDTNTTGIPKSVERWWPADLCLVVISTGLASSAEVLERIAEGTFVDPLVKAQQWFLDRDKREAVIEAQRKADENAKSEEMRLAESGVGSQAQDVTIVNQAGRVDQYLSAQEASSIYPTPPDGLMPHAQSSVHQDTTITSVAGGHTPRADDHEANTASFVENDRSDIDMSVGKFETEEKQDLFEDMDTEMFEAHGLTEDDFNFFDEPGGKDDTEALLERPDPALPFSKWAESGKGQLASPVALPVHEVLVDMPMEDQDASDKVPQKLDAVVSGNAVPLDSPELVKEERHAVKPEYEKIDEPQLNNDQDDSEALLESNRELLETDSAAKQSSYSLVALRGSLHKFDDKYRNDGKFAASFPEPLNDSGPGKAQPALDRKLPKLGPLTVSSPDSEDMDDASSNSGSINDWHYDHHSDPSTNNIHQTPIGEAGPSLSKKRKRESSVVIDGLAPPAVSADLLNRPYENSEGLSFGLEQDVINCHASIDLFSADNYLDSHGPTLYGNNQTFIQIAQLVADQKVLQNGLIRNTYHDPEQPFSSDNPQSSSDIVQAILSKAFPIAQQCNLRSFLELESSTSSECTSTAPSSQGDRRATALSHDTTSKDDQIQKLVSPYIRVRRGETAMEMANTALYFWEELSLAPAQETKNVMAFCLYPENDTICNAVSLFMTTMEVSYQSCKLGRHQRGSGLQKYQEGLVPFHISSASPDSVFESVEEACAGLGTDLPHDEADGMNYVIYMVNPFNDDAALPQLCSAFLQLFSTYVSSMKMNAESVPRDLVLQVIPISFLADCHYLIIPPPKAYTGLAFEVYSRCSPTPRDTETMRSPFTSTSAIRLARPIPKTINFQLTPQPLRISLSADSCIHLAYSWDNESQWLACSWSDNLGTLQWTTIYCLQDPKQDYWAMFSLTVEEILDTTKDMLEPSSIPWRLYIVKDRVLQRQELETWRLHSTSTFQRYFTVTILSIDSSPSLSFPPYQAAGSFPLASSNLDTSPAASTPFDQVHTPEHSSPMNTQTPSRHTHNSPATPSATGFTDPDPAARLIDVVSETWSMISPSPIQDPYLTTPLLAPVLVGGYLLKRAGTNDEDGMVPLGINLVSMDLSKNEPGISQMQTKMLKDVLSMYGDLACLARMRGAEEWKSGVLPWHVAAARKARKASMRQRRVLATFNTAKDPGIFATTAVDEIGGPPTDECVEETLVDPRSRLSFAVINKLLAHLAEDATAVPAKFIRKSPICNPGLLIPSTFSCATIILSSSIHFTTLQMHTLLQLPDELLLHITSFVSRHDIENWALANRRLFNISTDIPTSTLQKHRRRKPFTKVTIELPGFHQSLRRGRKRPYFMKWWTNHPFWLLRALFEDPGIAEYDDSVRIVQQDIMAPNSWIGEQLAELIPVTVFQHNNPYNIQAILSGYLRELLLALFRTQIDVTISDARIQADPTIVQEWYDRLLHEVSADGVTVLILLQLRHLRKLVMEYGFEGEAESRLMMHLIDARMADGELPLSRERPFGMLQKFKVGETKTICLPYLSSEEL